MLKNIVHWSIIQATDLPLRTKVKFLFVKIPLTYKHLLYKSFVRRSVGQATKGRNVKICIIFKENLRSNRVL